MIGRVKTAGATICGKCCPYGNPLQSQRVPTAPWKPSAPTLSTDTTAELLTNHQPGGGSLLLDRGGLILRYRSDLRFFSQFLRVNLRQEDILCRIGGDEFSLILPDTDAQHAEILFDRVKAKLDRVDLSLGGKADIRLSFSCGIASFKAEHSSEDFIDQADHALYTAKARGRNQVVAASFSPALANRFVN